MLQPGRELLAAGYALYSSSVLLVLSWGSGVRGFTLDRTDGCGAGDFLLSHPGMQLPKRGEPLICDAMTGKLRNDHVCRTCAWPLLLCDARFTTVT